jgi:hypothetical protein
LLPVAALEYMSEIVREKVVEDLGGTYWLITIDIPLWQCFPWEQYNQIGLSSIIIIVYVGVLTASAATGMYPENISPFGEHGLSKVEVTTEWFFGANWNCTISPTAAFISLGAKVRDPFIPPTRTTWTVTIPDALPVDPAFGADDTLDWAMKSC